MNLKEIVLEIDNIKKDFHRGVETIHALKGVSYKLEKGKIVALMGPSGSGKTTLLNIIGCMDSPSTGEVYIDNNPLSELSEQEKIEIRRNHLGFVFQDNHLIQTLTALENVNLPTMFSGLESNSNAEKILTKVGLADRLKHKPAELSGGQNQRVAIARALINEPSLILADEPTGKLDLESKQSVFDLFRELANEGLSILLATHDQDIANQCDEVLILKGGQLVN